MNCFYTTQGQHLCAETFVNKSNSSPSPSPSVGDFKTQILGEHNRVRALFGGSPPLTWDANLAASASNWNRVMCQKGSQVHSNYSTYSTGENLAAGLTGPQAVDAWFDEYKGLAPVVGNPEAYFKNGAGHFTQVVWNGTTAVGCDSYVCPTTMTFGSRKVNNVPLVTCEYNPTGNVLGMYSYNVPSQNVAALLSSVSSPSKS